MMHLRISLSVLLLLLSAAATSSAVTREEAASAVTTRYRITTPAFLGGFKEIGSVLTPRREGLRANRPSKAFKPNIIKNRQLVTPGGGQLSLGSAHDGALKPGDRLYLYEVHTGEEFVQLDLFTVATYVLPGIKGATPLQGSVRFEYDGGLAGVTTAQLLGDIGEWLSAEGSSAEGGVPAAAMPRAAGSPTVTVRLGQTLEEVTGILGPPEKQLLLGSKTIFVYGRLKVVFIDGKVVDAE